jgi:azurin
MATIVSRREFIKTLGILGGFAVSSAVIAACGGGNAAPTSAPAAGAAVILDIASKGDELMYDKDALSAPAGSKITLNFKNNSTALQHNWVLAKPGTQDTVANDGMAAGVGKNYLKDNDANVIAHLDLVKPGQTASVTFDAPAPGAYPYFCSFPGHYVLMKGTLTIK